jgi:hypothetical protein
MIVGAAKVVQVAMRLGPRGCRPITAIFRNNTSAGRTIGGGDGMQ